MLRRGDEGDVGNEGGKLCEQVVGLSSRCRKVGVQGGMSDRCWTRESIQLTDRHDRGLGATVKHVMKQRQATRNCAETQKVEIGTNVASDRGRRRRRRRSRVSTRSQSGE